MLFDLTEMDHPDQVLAVRLCMPLFDPFELVPGNIFPVIKTYKDPYEEIIGQLMRLMMIKLFVFVFILITQRRKITQHGRSSREGAGAFAIKELFVGKPALDHHPIVLILYKGKRIVVFDELG